MSLGATPAAQVFWEDGCLTESALADFTQGVLNPGLQPQVDQHLRGCSSCRSAIAALFSAPGMGRAAAGVLPRPGAQVGRYIIDEQIGSGGMGVVYRARDPLLGRPVAVKMMRPSWTDALGERGSARLVQEAQALAKLSHPNVLAIHDMGNWEGHFFLAMEWVDGGDLRAWTCKRKRSWREVVKVFIQAGEGLLAAHRAGLVHRDFKPQNVLVGTDGRVRVADFGLVRAERSSGGQPLGPPASMELTGTHELLGTPAYMSPEQVAGLPVDARSDQFSFCVALFESLYGQRPFVADSLEGLRQALQSGISAPADDHEVPARARQAVVRGLALKPEERFPVLDALLSELHTSTSVLNPRRRGRSKVAAAAGLCALTGLAVAAWLFPSRPHRPSPSPTASEQAALPPERAELPPAPPAPRAAPESAAASGATGLSTSKPAQKGSLRLSIYPWGDVYLDGVLITRGTRLIKIKVSPGHHVVRVVHPTFPAQEVGVDISSGKTTDQEVLLGTARR
jgi:serine/threonine protein kinase